MASITEEYMINPITKHKIKIGGRTYKTLVKKGKLPIPLKKSKIPIVKKEEVTQPAESVKEKIPLARKEEIAIPIKPIEGLKGKVRIGQKRRRGVKGDKDASMPGYKNIDVTSGS